MRLKLLRIHSGIDKISFLQLVYTKLKDSRGSNNRNAGCYDGSYCFELKRGCNNRNADCQSELVEDDFIPCLIDQNFRDSFVYFVVDLVAKNA